MSATRRTPYGHETQLEARRVQRPRGHTRLRRRVHLDEATGFHTVTPNIIVDDAEEAIAFLKAGLGATERYRLTLPNGTIAHGELKLGNSVLNLGESMERWPARGLVAQIFVEDSDASFERAVDAGATVVMPMTDMFVALAKDAYQILQETSGLSPRSRKPVAPRDAAEAEAGG